MSKGNPRIATIKHRSATIVGVVLNDATELLQAPKQSNYSKSLNLKKIGGKNGNKRNR